MQTGRWTIVARATPMQRRPSIPWLRERVHVRCVCGHERIAWVEDLEAGRSRGCDSRRCAARFAASEDIRAMLTGWVARESDALRAHGVADNDVDAFSRDRQQSADAAIQDYLRPTQSVFDLEPPAATTVFRLRA